MIVSLAFLGLLAVIGFWWLAHQRLMSRPWLEQGVIGDMPTPLAARHSSRRVGLGFLLAVIGSLFALLVGAYFMRQEYGDWRPLPSPGILWVSTALLVFASLALEYAHYRARSRGNLDLRAPLAVAFFAGVAFVISQLTAWQILVADGYLLAGNPANSFFYLATGLHGLHVLAGLAALALVSSSAWRKGSDRLELSVELCSTYWLFMLFVWVVLLALLTGGASQFIDLCRQLLT